MRFLAVLIVVVAACQQPDPKLGTTVETLVVVNPSTPHDFGSLQVGQTSAPFTVTVNPSGTNTYDQITDIQESCPDFSVSAPGLPADVFRTCDTCCPAGQIICPQAPAACCISDQASYSFDTFFSPTVAGMSSCVVTIVLNNGSSTKTVTLTGTGTPPPIHVDVQPGSVNFGDVRRNTDSTAVGINVSNSGGSTMTVSSVSISAGFTIMSGPTGTYDVGAGGTQPYSVVCHPSATGPMSGAFVVNSNDPGRPQVSVPLSCNGIDSNLTINPSPVTLPTTRVGEPVQATVTLQNSGAAPMQIESVSVTGQDLSMTSGPGSMSLPGMGSTTLTVGFTAGSKESATGNLVVTYDGGQQRTAQLAARALGTSMALSPDGDIDFGPVCAGQSAQQDFTIIGNDEGSFKVTTITPPDAPYTLSAAPNLPATVQGAGANMVTFTVTAAPTAAGHQVSTMMVGTDIPGGQPHMINLALDGLTAGVSASPASVDFGSNPIQTTTIGQDIHLANCSTGAITASNARIEGMDATEFAIVQQPDNAMIQPTQSASWLVVLQAHTTGTKAANFVVDYDGGSVTVPLAGEGLGDMTGSGSGSDSGVGEKSYYSCAAGGASSAWPLALVALVFTVRRRRAPSRRS